MKDKDREIFLEELKKHGLENDIPNISFTNARFLRDLIKLTRPQKILEIGTANGFSAINMAIECEKYGGHIDTIEFSERAHKVAEGNIQDVGLTSIITQHNANALELLPELSGEFDFIFIDGMKRRTKDFFTLSFPLLKKGGVIIIDDVILFKEKMQNLYDYLEENNFIYNVIPLDVNDGVIMIIK